MTVVAYKNGLVAADKQSSRAGTISEVQKLFRYKNSVLAIVGDYSRGLQIMEWYKKGKGPLPPASDNAFARFLVFNKDHFLEFENIDIPIKRTDKMVAFGSGGDLAMGAMAMGATADYAVEIACKFSDSCGLGVMVEKIK